VEQESFRNLMRVHDPQYKVMGRERLSTLISQKYLL